MNTLLQFEDETPDPNEILHAAISLKSSSLWCALHICFDPHFQCYAIPSSILLSQMPSASRPSPATSILHQSLRLRLVDPYEVEHLNDGLVGSAAGSSATEEEVDNEADNWEEEDEEAPKNLIQGRASRLENLDCRKSVSVSAVTATDLKGEFRMRKKLHTESNDIKNQDNETNYSTSTAVFPGVAVTSCSECLFGHDEREEGELDEEGEGVVEHDCS